MSAPKGHPTSAAAGTATLGDASEAFDAALATWLSRQAVVEERLTSFAFREGLPPVEVPVPSSHAALRRWIVAMVADRDVAVFLHRIDGDGRATAELAAAGAFGLEPGDRIALAARVGVLAASGLVSRDLEGDRVTLTQLGRTALALAGATDGATAPAAGSATPLTPAETS